MATTLDQVVADLLDDLVDGSGSSLLSEAYLERCAERALPVLAADLGVAYVLDESGSVTPEIDGLAAELWTVGSQIIACERLWRTASNLYTFTSGDKKVDHSKEASNWKDQLAALRGEYKRRVAQLNPAMDESRIQTGGLAPKAFERGRCYCPCTEEECPS